MRLKMQVNEGIKTREREKSEESDVYDLYGLRGGGLVEDFAGCPPERRSCTTVAMAPASRDFLGMLSCGLTLVEGFVAAIFSAPMLSE